jgi:hypothetical protein
MASLVLLGAAYAVLEEGLMVASFQNPHWMDLGVLGVFGRWIGVNWVWAVELTFYHSIVSITVPIIIVELVYHERRDESWLSSRWFKVVLGLLIADVVIGLFLFSVFTGFRPPIPQYLFMMLVTASLVFTAFRLPSDYARRGTARLRRPGHFFALTTMFAFLCGVIFWVLPNVFEFPMAPLVVILLGSIVVLGYIRYLFSFDWMEAIPQHRFALAAGALTPLILSAFLQEFDKSRVDDTSGMAIVGILFLIGLVTLHRSLKRAHAN